MVVWACLCVGGASENFLLKTRYINSLFDLIWFDLIYWYIKSYLECPKSLGPLEHCMSDMGVQLWCILSCLMCIVVHCRHDSRQMRVKCTRFYLITRSAANLQLCSMRGHRCWSKLVTHARLIQFIYKALSHELSLWTGYRPGTGTNHNRTVLHLHTFNIHRVPKK